MSKKKAVKKTTKATKKAKKIGKPTVREIDPKCIFTQKPIVQKDLDTLDEFYGLIGDQDYFDSNNYPRLIKEDKRVLAKKVFSASKKPRYLIKINTEGKFHNPLNVTSKEKSSYLDKTRRELKFKSVSQKVFTMYTNFLRTKNLSWLHNADREAE